MVIPVFDQNPVRRRPYVTYALIALNVLVFLMQPIARSSVSGDVAEAQACRQSAFFQRWGAVPAELMSNDPLDLTLAGEEPEPCAVVEPEYRKSPLLSTVSAMFLHGGLLHLLGNMLFLFVFGNNVEDRLGRVKFLLAYLVWGVIATYGFAAANADEVTVVVGASGAIAGVLGAYLVLFPKARVISLVPFLFFFPMRLPAWLVLGSWFALQAMYSSGATLSEGSGVAYLAHAVGFVAGVVGGLMFRGGRRTREPAWG